MLYNSKSLIGILSFPFFLLLISCVKKYDCKTFDLKHPIMAIAPSPNLSNKLIFINEMGDKIEMVKKNYYCTGPYEEKCGFPKRDCGCEYWMEMDYSNDKRLLYFNYYLIYYIGKDNPEHYVSYSLATGSFVENFSIDYNNINHYIDSLSKDSIEYNNETYFNIIEFPNSSNTYANSDDTVNINKCWIKPGIGIVKFWVYDTCWSLFY